MSVTVFPFVNDLLADVLESVDDAISGLSDEQLSDLLTDVSDLVEEIDSDLSQLAITSALDQGVALIEDLSSSFGTITINGPSLLGELSMDGALRTFTTDLSDEVEGASTQVSAFFADVNGSASFNNGQLTGDLIVGDSQYELDLDIIETLTFSLLDVLSTVDTPLSFTDGKVLVDIDTALGDIDGTVDFAGGDLDFDLTTPFGQVETSIDFPENAQFEVPFDLGGLASLNLVLDLAEGVISVPLFGGLEISLETLSGELGFTPDGLANLSLDIGLPSPVETTFEIDPLVGQLATELVEDFSGELTVDSGEVSGTIASRFGESPVTVSLNELLLQADSVLDATIGMLTLDNGIAGISLDTPFGELAGDLAVSPIAEGLATVSSLLA